MSWRHSVVSWGNHSREAKQGKPPQTVARGQNLGVGYSQFRKDLLICPHSSSRDSVLHNQFPTCSNFQTLFSGVLEFLRGKGTVELWVLLLSPPEMLDFYLLQTSSFYVKLYLEKDIWKKYQVRSWVPQLGKSTGWHRHISTFCPNHAFSGRVDNSVFSCNMAEPLG